MLKRYAHAPTHFFLDDAAYFITGAIYQKRRLLADCSLKNVLLASMRQFFSEYGWELLHWVILDNHYHLMVKSRNGADLPALFRKIHSCSARAIRHEMACELPIWWNYWDYCPRDEHEYFTRLNYLFYNPVKHCYVTDLREFPASSFHAQLDNSGRAVLVQQFQQYPAYKTLILGEAEDDNF